jgi:hypothetical protein
MIDVALNRQAVDTKAVKISALKWGRRRRVTSICPVLKQNELTVPKLNALGYFSKNLLKLTAGIVANTSRTKLSMKNGERDKLVLGIDAMRH